MEHHTGKGPRLADRIGKENLTLLLSSIYNAKHTHVHSKNQLLMNLTNQQAKSLFIMKLLIHVKGKLVEHSKVN